MARRFRILHALRSVVVGLLAFAAATAGLELFLRTSGATVPRFTVGDSLLGYHRVPGADIVFYSDGMRVDRVNEQGLLGPAVPYARTPGVPRVAIVGDSYVEGLLLPGDRTLRGRLERDLSERLGRPVEVINLGFSAFRYMDFWQVVERLVPRWSPDLVLVVVRGASLLEDARAFGPHFRLEGDSVVVDRSFAHTRRFQFHAHAGRLRSLSLYALAYRLDRLVSGGPEWWIPCVFRKASRPIGWIRRHVFHKADHVYRHPLDPKLVRRVLDDYRQWNERRGPGRIVIVDAGDLPDDVRAAIDEREIPRIDVGPALERLRAKGIDPTWWGAIGRHGHWNDAGLEAVSRAIAEALVTEPTIAGSLAHAGAVRAAPSPGR